MNVGLFKPQIVFMYYYLLDKFELESDCGYEYKEKKILSVLDAIASLDWDYESKSVWIKGIVLSLTIV